jgi:mono/diheme cytochrome c family protein
LTFNTTALLTGAIALGLGIWLVTSLNTPDPTSEPMVEVTVPQLNAVEATGQALFDNNCATCHGKNAAGQDGVAPPLVHMIYEPGHHADISFQRAAKLGVRAHHWPFGNMPPVESVDEASVSKIISYVRALQRANGIH